MCYRLLHQSVLLLFFWSIVSVGGIKIIKLFKMYIFFYLFTIMTWIFSRTICCICRHKCTVPQHFYMTVFSKYHHPLILKALFTAINFCTFIYSLKIYWGLAFVIIKLIVLLWVMESALNGLWKIEKSCLPETLK